MPESISKYNIFEYYLEDTDCFYCLYRKRKRKNKERGCDCDECCCEDIHADAIAHGRIKRDRGWNKWHM